MLKKLTEASFISDRETMYNQALDLKNSCYPSYADGIKTKEDFFAMIERGLFEETCPVFCFYERDTMLGWIQCEIEVESKYIQFLCFNVAKQKKLAIEDMMHWIEENYSGFEICFGCSTTNDVITILIEYGFLLVDDLYAYKMDLEHWHEPKISSRIFRVTKENYEDFRTLHTLAAKDIYWNSERIFKTLSEWEIFLFYENELPLAASYTYFQPKLSEIYGIDKQRGNMDLVIQKLISATLTSCKAQGGKTLFYLCEEEEREVLKKLGFTFLDHYQCYIRKKE